MTTADNQSIVWAVVEALDRADLLDGTEEIMDSRERAAVQCANNDDFGGATDLTGVYVSRIHNHALCMCVSLLSTSISLDWWW